MTASPIALLGFFDMACSWLGAPCQLPSSGLGTRHGCAGARCVSDRRRHWLRAHVSRPAGGFPYPCTGLCVRLRS
jgi:hypothetical protein